MYDDWGYCPTSRCSKGEGFLDLRVSSDKPKGWRSARFGIDGTLFADSNIWFGVFCEYCWFPRFDYAAYFYAGCYEEEGAIPEEYPEDEYDIYPDIKLSMYFTYTSSRIYYSLLDQNVGLSDNRNFTAGYKRGLKETAGVYSLFSTFETFFRNCIDTVQNSTVIKRFSGFFRNTTGILRVNTENSENRSLSRKCTENAGVFPVTKRTLGITRRAAEVVNNADTQRFSVFFLRSVSDASLPSGKMRHLGAFIRGLPVVAGNVAETTHKGDYYRFRADTVKAQGPVFRGLILFIKIMSKIFVREYLLGRFLKAREELVIKSAVSREIILSSKIS